MIRTLLAINLKALLAGILNAGGGSKKRSKGKTVLFILLFVYCLGAFLLLFGVMFLQICETFFSLGIGWLYFALAALISVALCLITSIFAMQSQVFGAKDNELLLAMPVKPSAIVVSRILCMLIYEYLFNFMVALPAIAVWWISGYATYTGTFLFVLGFLLVPLLALALGCVLGWVLAVVLSRARAKNVITIVLSLAFLGAYFYFYANMQKYLAELISNGVAIADAVKRAVFPIYHFGVAVAEGNMLSFLIFALCAIAPFALMCVLLTHSFIKIATMKRGAAKIVYKERALRASGAKAALLGIELKRISSNAMLLMNAGLGSIVMLALAAVLIVKPSLIIGAIAPIMALFPNISLTVLGGAAVMALCSMISVSASSISLEGKTLWLVKSLPVGGGDILIVKALAHILFSGVPALVASAACIARFGGSAVDMLAAIVGPVSFSVAMGFFGVFINLMFPKLDWINEIQAVKQGMSVVICMLGTMALVIALVVIYVVVLAQFMSIAVFMLACSAVFLLLSALIYAYLKRGGTKRFAALV